MDSHVENESSASTQARGRVWSTNEVLSLLEIWKEQKLQSKLKKNYRNLDVFKLVSEEMAKRNHSRSAEECRSKSKKIRFEYRRVVKHNERSGSNPVTCPFYRELDDLFHGDVSITPNRLSRSLDFEREGTTQSVTQDSTATSLTTRGTECAQEANSRQDSDEDSDETFLDDQINTHPITVLESGPQQIEEGVPGERVGEPERNADGTSSRAEEHNEPEDSQPNVIMSPGTRLRSNRSRNRRARRGEHIARNIMQSASREAQLSRRTQERFMEVVHSSMKDCRKTEIELLNVMREDVRGSAHDRQLMLQYMQTMTELYRRKVEHECGLPMAQHGANPQRTTHTSFVESSGDVTPSRPGPSISTELQEQPSTSCFFVNLQRSNSPDLFEEVLPNLVPESCPGSPTIANTDDVGTVQERQVHHVSPEIDAPANEGIIVTGQCESTAGAASLQCPVAPSPSRNKPCSSRHGRIIKKKKIFSP